MDNFIHYDNFYKEEKLEFIMPKSNDPKITVNEETRTRLNIYKASKKLKSQQDAINHLLDLAEGKEDGTKRRGNKGI